MTKARKLSFRRGHDTVGDDFARCVLHVDGGVRREVFRKSVQKRHVLLPGGPVTRDRQQRGDHDGVRGNDMAVPAAGHRERASLSISRKLERKKITI